MKIKNLIRKLLLAALLVGGILAAGAENKAFADGTGLIGAIGGRSGYIGTGTRAADTTSTQNDGEAESQNFLEIILEFLF
jgi:hypothetical protein